MRLSKTRLRQIEEAEERFFGQIGIEWPYKPPKQKPGEIVKGKRLVLSDPHTPYACKETMGLALEHRDAEIVIIAGDVFDGASKSRFRLMEHVDFNEEVRGTFGFLEWLYVNFPGEKRILKGNHDSRAEKKIAGLLADGHTDLLALTEMDLLGRLVSYFPGMSMVGVELPILGEGKLRLGHIYQMGDVVFTHAERSQEHESALLRRIATQVDRWAHEFRLSPWRVLFQGHNHTDSHCWEGERYLTTLPCMMDNKTKGGQYVFGPRMGYKPAKRGVTTFFQSGGRTDINSIRKEIL